MGIIIKMNLVKGFIQGFLILWCFFCDFEMAYDVKIHNIIWRMYPENYSCLHNLWYELVTLTPCYLSNANMNSPHTNY